MASEEMFNEIALTIVALQQSSLLAPTPNDPDGNGRLNGYILSKQSTFIKTLTHRLLRPGLTPRENVNTLDGWLILQVLEILEIQSPDIQNFVDLLLRSIKDDEVYQPSTIGTLLSIHANGNLSANIDAIFEILTSHLGDVTSDIKFLEGLERLLAKLPAYTLFRPF